jgi:starch-binding outer membrane protein, SusD/RagB family
MTTRTPLRFLALAAIALPLAACGLLDVEAPGRIADENLNSVDAIPAIVTGMSYDLAQSLDNSIETISLASGELWHGGSYNLGDIPRGIILDEDVNGEWSTMQQARWVAEDGIRRIGTLLDESDFNKSPFVARAYMLAGIANRQLGENLCETVIDGGALQPHTIHFSRAEEQFDKAIQIGQAAGASAADYVTGAYAGRASVRAWQGDWAGAVEDAAKVPVGFVAYGYLSSDGESNTLAYETHDRFEYTVFSTEFEDRPNDPRAPWEIVHRSDGSVATGANGTTPMYQQEKYINSGDDIPLVKGTEMLVLRAEAALRSNDISTAITRLNEARAFYGMQALATPATMQEAWDILHAERDATVWLENRHFWDARRWYEETGPAHYDFLNSRDKCIPISQDEKKTNSNLRG